jgi:phage replication O-like protein O
MEGPQKENGFTPIANEILENMAKIKLSPTQYRILFVVWRYTYGFNRKEHELSLSFLSTATGCDKRQLQRELKGLEERKVIIQSIKTGAYRKIKFNKHHKQWVGEIAIGETSIGEIDNGESVNTTIGETVNTSIGEIDNQERNKENIKESNKLSISETFNAMFEYYPNKLNMGKTKAKQHYIDWLKGRKIKGQTNIKLNPNQVYIAMQEYAETYKKDNPKDLTLEFMKRFDTFMNLAVLDYVEQSKQDYEAFMLEEHGPCWDKLKFEYTE